VRYTAGTPANWGSGKGVRKVRREECGRKEIMGGEDLVEIAEGTTRECWLCPKERAGQRIRNSFEKEEDLVNGLLVRTHAGSGTENRTRRTAYEQIRIPA